MVCLLSLIGDVIFLVGMFAGLLLYFFEVFELLHLCMKVSS